MLQPDPEQRPSSEALLRHPYVREHSNRLHEDLQAYAKKKERLEDGNREFEDVYEGLKSRLGGLEAAKTVVKLMAPELVDHFENLNEHEARQLALKAWNLKKPPPSKPKDYSKPSIGEDTEELTMTLRQINVFEKAKKPGSSMTIKEMMKRIPVDVSVIQLKDQLLRQFPVWNEFIKVYECLQDHQGQIVDGDDAECTEKLRTILGNKKFAELSKEDAFGAILRLIQIEDSMDSFNVG